MADAPVLPGSICRAYVLATPFAETCDTEAEFLSTLAGAFVRIDDILSEAKRMDNRQTADLKERGRDYQQTLVGGRVLGFTAKITKRPGHSGYDILKAAYEANSVLAVGLATGNIATTGTKTMCFNAQITKWDQDEPDPGATTHDLELKVTALSAVNPTEVTKA